MRKFMLIGLVALAAGEVWAGGFGLKPGLWQTRVVKQVIDGRDTTAQIAGMASKMREAMANVPPEQRARMAAMMKDHGGPSMGADGTVKMCVSAAQAHRDAPIVDRTGHCQPSIVTHSGSRTTYTFHCSSDGNTTTGKGESTTVGDDITTRVDVTTRTASGATHVIHSESELKYLGPDCGDVKPMPMPQASR